jgi:predicted nucleotidyltransferase
MRLHAALEDLLSGRTAVKVLRTLVTSEERGWTGRELATVARSSAPQTVEILKRFERIGLVWRSTVGRAHVWHLTSDHALVDPIRTMFDFEKDLPDQFVRELRSELKRLPLRRATLFGSIARGTETDDSDADLYLEPRNPVSESHVQAKLTPLVIRFIKHYGVVLSPIIGSASNKTRLRNPSLMKAIEGEGIELLGEVT